MASQAAVKQPDGAITPNLHAQKHVIGDKQVQITPPQKLGPILISDKNTTTQPPANAAKARPRHWLLALSFWIIVLIPCAITGAYLSRVAIDQYSSKVGFSIQREDSSSPLELLGGLSSLTNFSSSDTDILYEYLQSQKLVEKIDQQLDLKQIWTHPEDVVFSLSSDASIEELVEYWNRMVRISYGNGTGLIELEVLAFSAEDATIIATALLEKSAQMINDLSDISQQDTIIFAKNALGKSMERLKVARSDLTRFRNLHQIVDPELDIKMQAGLLENLQKQQAVALVKIDLLKSTARANDPRIKQEKRHLEVIENRIQAERKKLGLGEGRTGSQAFADLLGEYENLVVEREFAEKAYLSSLASYDNAQAEAQRKTRYLATYLDPTKAQTPLYPKRFTLFALVSLFLVLIWSILVLIAYSIRDRH